MNRYLGQPPLIFFHKIEQLWISVEFIVLLNQEIVTLKVNGVIWSEINRYMDLCELVLHHKINDLQNFRKDNIDGFSEECFTK